MTSFADIRPDQIRTDCRFYSGYKPCGKHDGCPDCPEHQPRGAEILLIKLGAMGDVLRTKCLLPGLKRRHPQSWITWVTAPGSEALVRDPLVDEVRPFNESGLMALEGRQFDELLCLDKEAPALALSRRLPAARKYGYAPTEHNTATVWNEGAEYALRLGLSDELKFHRNTLTHQQILYQLAELEYAHDEYRLEVPGFAQEHADAILAAANIPAGRPLIGLNTGCGPAFETKQWDVGQMAELIERLAQSTDAAILLLGGQRERPIHEELLARASTAARARIVDTGNHNALEVFAGLVRRTAVVITADSLAMHVAIALQRHVVVFFGPTCEQEVDLYGRGERIVTDYACSPCYLKRCDVRPSCMQALTAPTVEAAVSRVLESALRREHAPR